MGASTNAPSVVELGNSAVFLLSTSNRQVRPKLPLAVDNIVPPSLLTLLLYVGITSQSKLPENKLISKMPASQTLFPRRNPGARDEE